VEVANGEKNRRVYGTSENKYGKAVVRANFSGLYDVCNRFFLDIGVHHFRSSEIEEGAYRGTESDSGGTAGAGLVIFLCK
jgi:hypothetical protein